MSPLPSDTPAPASWSATARLGALLGLVSGGWLVSLQGVSARLAGMAWTIDDPGRDAWLYPLAGAAAGLGLGLLGEGVRRLLFRRVDPLAFCAGTVGLAAYAGRAGVTALLRAREGMPGGSLGAVAAQALVVALLALGCVAWLHRRQRARPAPARVTPVLFDGLGVALVALAATFLVHQHVLAIKQEARLAGWLGPQALLLTGGAGLLGLLAGVGLAWPRAVARGPLLRVGATALACVLAFTLSLQELRPPTALASARADARGPNVLLIVLDTLRRDAVSAYGVVEHTTPALDAFARRGVLFEDCVANGSWTVPSHASLFTGAEVSRHGAGHLRTRLRVRPGGEQSMPLFTLAELLGGQGWRTAAFVCNMNVSAINGFDRGFAEFHEIWRAHQGDFDVLAPARRAWLDDGVFDKGGEVCLRGARDWLGERADDEQPWFLFVNFMEAHSPYYQAPAEFARRFLRDHEPSPPVQAIIDDVMAHVHAAGVSPEEAEELWRVYLGGVLYQDWLLGQLLDELERSGAADDTLVLITSDHGENFGWNALLGHGQDLNDDLLRVPLVMAGPGLPEGRRDGRPVSLVDVLPTVVSLLDGRELPPDPGRSGLALAGAHEAEDARFDGRLRWVEKYPVFREDVAEYLDATDGEARWAWARRGVYRDGVKSVMARTAAGDWAEQALGDVPGPRLTELVSALRPPADDGRRPLDDDELARVLQRWLRDVPWDEALEAEGLPLVDEELTRMLRELGYAGH